VHFTLIKPVSSCSLSYVTLFHFPLKGHIRQVWLYTVHFLHIQYTFVIYAVTKLVYALSFTKQIDMIRSYTQGTQDEERKQNNKKQPRHNIICVGHHCAQTNTNNVNTTWVLKQTTGGKDEPNIFFYEEIVTNITTRNSERNRTTQTKKLSNTDCRWLVSTELISRNIIV